MLNPSLYVESLRSAVTTQAPTLLALFETMAAEALFARTWMADDLATLPTGASILEVGGGTFTLGCMLAEEGFAVTSIEPVGDGFGEFRALADIVLATAKARPGIAAVRGEDFVSDQRFDFAFSVNVMEHVESPQNVIARVMAALKPGASYRFFCPNYLFPYEPHFNIPTLFTKDITQFVFHQRIHNHPMPEPVGTWGSLNWITVPKVRHIAHQEGLRMECNQRLFVEILERATQDEQFAARRSWWMAALIRRVVKLRLHMLAAMVPVAIQPAMDVRLRQIQKGDSFAR